MKKRLFKLLLILALLGGLGFVGYRAYHYAIDAIAMRIKRDIKRGIFGLINPLRWPKKIFGQMP